MEGRARFVSTKNCMRGSNNASVVCLSSVVPQSREGWKKLLNAHGKNATHLQNGSQRSPTTMNEATTCDVEEAALNLRFWLPGLVCNLGYAIPPPNSGKAHLH